MRSGRLSPRTDGAIQPPGTIYVGGAMLPLVPAMLPSGTSHVTPWYQPCGCFPGYLMLVFSLTSVLPQECCRLGPPTQRAPSEERIPRVLCGYRLPSSKYVLHVHRIHEYNQKHIHMQAPHTHTHACTHIIMLYS